MFNTCSFYDKMDLEDKSKQYLSVFKSKEKKKEIGLQVYIYLRKNIVRPWTCKNDTIEMLQKIILKIRALCPVTTVWSGFFRKLIVHDRTRHYQVSLYRSLHHLKVGTKISYQIRLFGHSLWEPFFQELK